VKRTRIAALAFAWLVVICLATSLAVAHEYVFAGIVVLIAVIGTIVQVKRSASAPRPGIVTWAEAIRQSSDVVPEQSSLDTGRPLVGLIVRGAGAGRYVSVVIPDGSDWIYLVGPRRKDFPDELTDESTIDMSPGGIRYLPQGVLADELWRRNFHSLRRSDAFRALPIAGADLMSGKSEDKLR